MARGQHRFYHIRLLAERRMRAETYARNAPQNAKEKARRDRRMQALAARQLAAGVPLSPAVQSWVSRRAGKPFRKLSAEEVARAIG
ncbi:MAG: hypothetical protein RMM29_03690 [Planctomycetota bacterium]|nr:hypothetical protein [Planctomycetota bacterium]MCX8039012.1 hypothetical protein [Planctomycetota bacterium]MDW8372737.1 hypothetical protein [Planctomycetota bacterium]